MPYGLVLPPYACASLSRQLSLPPPKKLFTSLPMCSNLAYNARHPVPQVMSAAYQRPLAMPPPCIPLHLTQSAAETYDLMRHPVSALQNLLWQHHSAPPPPSPTAQNPSVINTNPNTLSALYTGYESSQFAPGADR